MVDRVLGRVSLPEEEQRRLRLEADVQRILANQDAYDRNVNLNALDAPGAPIAAGNAAQIARGRAIEDVLGDIPGRFNEALLLSSAGLGGTPSLVFEPPPEPPRTIDINQFLESAEPAAAPTRPARSAPAAAPSSAATPTDAQQGETAPQQDTQRAVQIVGQLLNTGSQGQPRPSYASDIADAQNRVATILARSLRGMDGAGGLERIGQAAIETLSGGGKVSFPEAMAQIEGKESSRAYNIANALSGLAKAQNAGQLSAKDQALLMARRSEAAARMGVAEARNLVSAVDKITSGYANKAAAQEAAWEYIYDWNSRNPGADPSRFSEVMRGTADYVQSKGLALARGRGGAGAGGGGGAGGGAALPTTVPANGGFYLGADGQEQFRPYTPVGRGSLKEWQILANDRAQRGDIAGAKEIVDAQSRRVVEGRGAQGDERELGKFRTQLAEAKTAIDVMDGMRAAIRQGGAAIMGASGALSSFITGISEQAASLVGMPDVRERIANANRSFNEELLKSEGARGAFAWLSRDTSAEATALKANLLILGTTLAKALDPNGRLSNQDVQQAIQIVGAQGPALLNNPTAMNAALDNVERYLARALENRRSTFPAISKVYGDPIDLRSGRTRPAAGEAPAAGAPPAVAPGRVLRWNPDKGDFD